MSQAITQNHASLLESSGISARFATECGVVSALTPADLPDSVPAYWPQILPGILFPWTGTDGHVEWQLRPDTTPERNGKKIKYLFRGTADGYMPTPWVLREPVGGSPVLYVEGTKQALCVAEHAPAGYGVVGLAGCWGGQERGLAASVLALSRGRAAIVILDADVRRNLQVFEAGRRMRENLLSEGATSVKRIEITGPDTIGIDDVLGAREDRDDHLARLIDRAEDYRYPRKDRPRPRVSAQGVLPPPGESAPNARAYLAATADASGRPMVRWWRENWAFYSRELGCWVVDEEKDALFARLFTFFEMALTVSDDGDKVPWNPTMASVAGVEAAVRSFSRVPSSASMPCWLNTDGEWRPPARECLTFPNGILHMPTGDFYAPDPDLFTTQGLPFDYDPAVDMVGTRWEKFLGEIFPNDRVSVMRLQEILGYLVSGRTDLEKIFLLYGRPRAGKGTIGRVLDMILGPAVTATSIEGLSGGTFSLESMLNRKLVIVGDARTGADPRRHHTAVERLLSISGGDSVRVERKFRSAVSGVLPVNFLIMSNEDFVLEESSGALASRFEMVEFTESFLGREDPGLKAELAGELPAVLRWCLDGLKRLDAQEGRFTADERSLDAQAAMREAGSPYIRFAQACLEFDPNGWASVQDLYDAWGMWALRNGVAMVDSAHLVRGLRAAYRGSISPSRRGAQDDRVRGLAGVRVSAGQKG